MTSQDEVSVVRKLQRAKRRLLLDFVDDAPTHRVQVVEQPPIIPLLRVREMSGASDSYEEVSVARRLQRMKRRLLLDHCGSSSPQVSVSELPFRNVMVLVEAPFSPRKPKSPMDVSYLKSGLSSPLESKGLHEIPDASIQVAKMA
jgi:hypothetical protein